MTATFGGFRMRVTLTPVGDNGFAINDAQATATFINALVNTSAPPEIDLSGRPQGSLSIAQAGNALRQALANCHQFPPARTGGAPAPPAQAASGGFEGTYRGRLGPQSLVIRRRAAGGFDVDIDASVPGCGATVTVVATEQNGVLRSQRAGSEMCRITFTRTSTGISTRDEGCSMFHGARCSFTSEFTRRRP